MGGLQHPIAADARGHLASITDDEQLRDMIRSVLFTSPGERVNRPTYGSGIRQLLFAPSSPAMTAAVQATVQAALQTWLGDVIFVESVSANTVESTLHVRITYRRLADGERLVDVFELSEQAAGIR